MRDWPSFSLTELPRGFPLAAQPFSSQVSNPRHQGQALLQLLS